MVSGPNLVPVRGAGVVDEAIDPPISRLRRVHQLLPVLCARRVRPEEGDRVRHVSGDSLPVVLVDVGDQDFGTLLGELPGDSFAKAMSTAWLIVGECDPS